MADRKAQWRAYNEWQKSHDGYDPRPLSEIFRDIDFIYSQYSEEVRRTDPDPEKRGIQEMRRILGLHEQWRRNRT